MNKALVTLELSVSHASSLVAKFNVYFATNNI